MPGLIGHIGCKVGAVQLTGAGALGHPVAVNLTEGGHDLGQRHVVGGPALLHALYLAVADAVNKACDHLLRLLCGWMRNVGTWPPSKKPGTGLAF
jgi:hypothetical protein